MNLYPNLFFVWGDIQIYQMILQLGVARYSVHLADTVNNVNPLPLGSGGIGYLLCCFALLPSNMVFVFKSRGNVLLDELLSNIPSSYSCYS